MKKWIFLFLFIPSLCWGGITFDGSDDRLIKSDAASLETPTTAVTTYCVVQYTGGENFSPCLEKSYDLIGTSPYISYKITLNEGGADNRSCGACFGGSFGVTCTSATTCTSGAKYALFGRWTSGEGFNFKAFNLTSGTTTTTTSATKTGTLSYSTGHLGIGGSGVDDGTGTLTGTVYEAAVWARKLSDAEVEAIATSKIKKAGLLFPTNLVFYYVLDDQPDGTSFDGDTAIDLSFNGNSATGNDGAGNTGLTATAETILTYP